jgi:hypothetical protein
MRIDVEAAREKREKKLEANKKQFEELKKQMEAGNKDSTYVPHHKTPKTLTNNKYQSDSDNDEREEQSPEARAGVDDDYSEDDDHIGAKALADKRSDRVPNQEEGSIKDETIDHEVKSKDEKYIEDFYDE